MKDKTMFITKGIRMWLFKHHHNKKEIKRILQIAEKFIENQEKLKNEGRIKK